MRPACRRHCGSLAACGCVESPQERVAACLDVLFHTVSDVCHGKGTRTVPAPCVWAGAQSLQTLQHCEALCAAAVAASPGIAVTPSLRGDTLGVPSLRGDTLGVLVDAGHTVIVDTHQHTFQCDQDRGLVATSLSTDLTSVVDWIALGAASYGGVQRREIG